MSRTRLTTAAALALAALVMGVVPTQAAVPPDDAAPAARGPRPAPVVATAGSGPVPLAWDGGVAVPVAPRWWPQGKGAPSAAWPSGWPRPVRFLPSSRGALSGLVVALDPGHDIGNSRHVSAINKVYWVGLRKTCNTTGTATSSGYAESTYAFDVVARLRRLLVAQGATVLVTRDRNTTSSYGPCVGARGAFGAQEKAALMVQVHADGGPATGRGFHVIAPAYYAGYTDDHYRRSAVLAAAMVKGMRAKGFAPATYLSSAIQVRKDQGGLNTSDVPIVTVETLNMRNAADARVATSATGRQAVAVGLYNGIVAFYRGS